MTHPLVAEFWHGESSGGVHRILPDGCVDFLFDLNSGKARVVGAMTRPAIIHLARGTRYFGLRFRPAVATQFIVTSANELQDADAPLRELVSGADELIERVLTAKNAAQRRAFCNEFLTRSTQRVRPPDARVVQAVRRLTAACGALPIAQLATELQLSERQLERLFALHVGIRPKLFARVMRLQATLNARGAQSAFTGNAARERVSQVQLSAQFGYADEPHLLREFRALAGCTLAELERERDVGFVQANPIAHG